jgi:photosystem II stability/assembly factor-like uncharacterized protein
MKITYFFAAAFLALSFNLNAQPLLSWEWQNPKPQGNTIKASDFVNPLIGFAITDNSILLKTINGGASFESHSPSLGTASFNDLDFADITTGYIVCNDGKIIKTVNGGLSWTFQNSGTDKHLTGVSFVNSLTGYAVGDSATVLKTTTGGASWVDMGRVDTIVNLKDVKFHDANTGYIIGRNSVYVEGAVPVFKTTNGGTSWVRQNASYLLGLSLCIKDANTVFAMGHFGEISKSTNRGSDWAVVNYHAYASVNSMQFLNDSVGIAAGSDGYILKTVDGGNTWTSFGPLPLSNNHQYFTVAFTSNTNGFLMGERGHILKTTNAGTSYDTVSAGLRNNLTCVQFINALTGYTAGRSKTLLKTTDGGLSWITRSAINNNPNSLIFWSMHFINENTGYLGYDLGIIARTTDGGLTFTNKQLPSTQAMHAIHFAGTDTGYAAGKNNFFYRTFNAGANWTRIYPDSGYFFGTFTDIEFLNAQTGFASNTNGRMYKTTNSGTNWIIDSLTVSDTLAGGIYGLHAITGSLIYAAGGSGRIFKTTDAGTSWTTYSAGDYNFQKVFFTNSNTGYAAGKKGTGGGAMLKTTNGGVNWAEQVTYTSSQINSVVFPSANIGYAVGDNGTILRTLTAGEHPVITGITGTTETAESYRLSQNYPNPFNPATNISFNIPAQALVTLKVYDILGREMAVLVNEVRNKGLYTVTFDGSRLASGVYFYRLNAGDFTETKRMMLLK